MRIAFICGFAWEPKGTVRLRAFPMAAELVKRGHEVTIFVIPYDNLTYSGKEWWSEGVHVVNAVLSKSGFIGFPWAITRLVQSVRTFEPNIVHVFKPKGFAGAVAELLIRTPDYPVVIDCDDWEGWGGWNEVRTYPWAVKQFIAWQERHLIKRARSVSVASRVLFSRAVEMRGASAGVVYLPNCLSARQLAEIDKVRDIDRASLLTELGLPLRNIILYVGHFDAADDVMFFAQAGSEAAQKEDAIIVFAGSGEQLTAVREFFTHRPEVDARFFGEVTYDIYLKLLAVSTIAAFPYPDNPIYRAKCSVRIVEFMAMGKPVVTTNIGQNVEYIADGVDGRLCAAGDFAGFVKCLTELLRDEYEQSRIGGNAYRKIRQSVVWELKTGELCETMYSAILRRPTPEPALVGQL